MPRAFDIDREISVGLVVYAESKPSVSRGFRGLEWVLLPAFQLASPRTTGVYCDHCPASAMPSQPGYPQPMSRTGTSITSFLPSHGWIHILQLSRSLACMHSAKGFARVGNSAELSAVNECRRGKGTTSRTSLDIQIVSVKSRSNIYTAFPK